MSYVTVAEEDEFLLAINGEEFEEKEMESAKISGEGMSAVAVAHYIMVHYAKKELIKKRKQKYKPKDGQYTLDSDLRKFGDEGETAVTKELHQFNTYNVLHRWKQTASATKRKRAHYHRSYSLRKKEMEQ
jgi:hypothetical protein